MLHTCWSVFIKHRFKYTWLSWESMMGNNLKIKGYSPVFISCLTWGFIKTSVELSADRRLEIQTNLYNLNMSNIIMMLVSAFITNASHWENKRDCNDISKQLRVSQLFQSEIKVCSVLSDTKDVNMPYENEVYSSVLLVYFFFVRVGYIFSLSCSQFDLSSAKWIHYWKQLQTFI